MREKMGKLASVVIILVLIFTMAFPVFAEDSEDILDNSTTLEQGYYSPDEVSGSTTRVKVSCPAVCVTSKQKAISLIQFSSKNITQVVVGGETYYPLITDAERGTFFDLPIPLNTEITVTATTVAMGGTPKEVTYQIKVGVGENPEKLNYLPDEEIYGENENSNNIVSSELGMVRITDYGTSVSVNDDGTMDITVNIKPLTRKYTSLYLGKISEVTEQSVLIPTESEKTIIGAASKGEGFALKYTASFSYRLPIFMIGKKQTVSIKQITDMPDGEEEWFNNSKDKDITTTFTVVETEDLHRQIQEKIDAAKAAAIEADRLVKEAEEKAADNKVSSENTAAAVKTAEEAIEEAKTAYEAVEELLTEEEKTEIALDEIVTTAETVVTKAKSAVKSKAAAELVKEAESVANNPDSTSKQVEEAISKAEAALKDLDDEQKARVTEVLDGKKPEMIINDAKTAAEAKAKTEKEKKANESTVPSSDSGKKNTVAVGTAFNSSNLSVKVTKAGEVSIQKNTNTKAKKVTIPATISYQGQTFKVTEIANKAFANNKKLTQVVIGKNITKIGKQAFKGDKKLKKITFKGNLVKSVGKKAFNGINKKATFKAPKKVLKKYKKLIKKAGAPKSAKYKK